MAKHGIIFGGHSVRAILEGAKTQTRRVMKPQPPPGYEPHIDTDFVCGKFWNGYGLWNAKNSYGQSGDLLWVRETCRLWDNGQPSQDSTWEATVRYRADHSLSHLTVMLEDCPENITLHEPPRWRSPIHMPRWASRLTLELRKVRPERLQDISPEDCLAEGLKGEDDLLAGFDEGLLFFQFMQTWDSLNAKRGFSWKTNPWVWVYDFQPVAK